MINKAQFLYDLARCDNYDAHFIRPKYSIDTAEQIHQYFDKMTNEEMKTWVVKCLTPNQMKKILLQHELNYYTARKQNMDLKQFCVDAQKILDRYQYRAGGFQFEDSKWLLHDYTSKQYHILQNEIVFENTVCKDDIKNPEIINFIGLLLKQLNNISNYVNVKLHWYYAKRDMIYYALLKCTYHMPIKQNKEECKK